MRSLNNFDYSSVRSKLEAITVKACRQQLPSSPQQQNWSAASEVGECNPAALERNRPRDWWQTIARCCDWCEIYWCIHELSWWFTYLCTRRALRIAAVASVSQTSVVLSAAPCRWFSTADESMFRDGHALLGTRFSGELNACFYGCSRSARRSCALTMCVGSCTWRYGTILTDGLSAVISSKHVTQQLYRLSGEGITAGWSVT